LGVGVGVVNVFTTLPLGIGALTGVEVSLDTGPLPSFWVAELRSTVGAGVGLLLPRSVRIGVCAGILEDDGSEYGVPLVAGLALALADGAADGEVFNIGNGVAVGVVSSSFLMALAECSLKANATMTKVTARNDFIAPV